MQMHVKKLHKESKDVVMPMSSYVDLTLEETSNDTPSIRVQDVQEEQLIEIMEKSPLVIQPSKNDPIMIKEQVLVVKDFSFIKDIINKYYTYDRN